MTSGLRGSMPPHGTANRYTHHGCRCDACGQARYRENVRYALGQHVRISPRLTTRRLQALACVGWGLDLLTGPTGLSRETLNRHRRGKYKTITPQAAAAVEAAYVRLWNQSPPKIKSSKTVRVASENGWSPPHPALLPRP